MPSKKLLLPSTIFVIVICQLFSHVSSFLRETAHAQVQNPGPLLDAQGWTAFTPSHDTRIIYVSNSSGSDLNDGRSTAKPIKTIAKGLSLIRTNYPDWLLLKKGDTWTNEVFGYFGKSGRSAREPMLISSYGKGERPLLKTDSYAGAAIGSLARVGGDFIALVGIEFYAHNRDPESKHFGRVDKEQSGIRFLNPSNWILIEDCKFSFYTDGLIFDSGPAQFVALRRNIVVDSYSPNSHAQGLYAANVRKILIEGNLFDHNGWNDKITAASPTIFNHNIYLQHHSGEGLSVEMKDNIVANASSHGAQLRNGGIVTDNLFFRNPIGLLTVAPSSVRQNVFLSANDITPSLPRGYGIAVNGGGSGPIDISHNILAHEASSERYGRGIVLDTGTTDATVKQNIIYHWDNPLSDKGKANLLSSNEVDKSGYYDPARDVDTYGAMLAREHGGESFIIEARKQRKDNWRPAYTAKAINAYIREGFGLR